MKPLALSYFVNRVPGTRYIDQVGLQYIDPPASVTQVLGIKGVHQHAQPICKDFKLRVQHLNSFYSFMWSVSRRKIIIMEMALSGKAAFGQDERLDYITYKGRLTLVKRAD